MASLKNETQSLILTTLTGAALFGTATAAYNQSTGNDLGIIPAALIGASASLGYHWLRHINAIKPYRSRRMASLAATAWQPGSNNSKQLKWFDKREIAPPEFTFAGLGLTRNVPETLLLDFATTACRRQELVICRRDVRKPNGRRMKANEPLSETYYTGRRNRFLPDDYFAIRYILQLTGIWLNARVGHPGLLYLDTYTPAPRRVVRVARWRWIELLESEQQPSWASLAPMKLVTKWPILQASRG